MFKKMFSKFKEFKLLKNKKGMTLIEVVVASAVSCIILCAALGIIIPTTNNITFNKNVANAKDMSTKVIYELKDKLKYAKAITIVDSTDNFGTSHSSTYNFYEEKIDATQRTTLAFSVPGTAVKTGYLADDRKYKNIKLRTTFDVDTTTNQLLVTVKAYKTSTGSPLLYTTTAKIAPLNCKANNIVLGSGATEKNAISCVI